MSRSIQRIKTCGVEEKNEPGCTTREKLQGCPSAGGALGSHLAVLQELNRPGWAGCRHQSQAWRGDELGPRVYPETARKGQRPMPESRFESVIQATGKRQDLRHSASEDCTSEKLFSAWIVRTFMFWHMLCLHTVRQSIVLLSSNQQHGIV